MTLIGLFISVPATAALVTSKNWFTHNVSLEMINTLLKQISEMSLLQAVRLYDYVVRTVVCHSLPGLPCIGCEVNMVLNVHKKT